MQYRDDTPVTALWSAAHAGDAPGASRLLAEGVDGNVCDKHGRNALTFAAAAGHLDVVRLLVEAGVWVDPFEEGSVFMTPLMRAAQNGHVDIANICWNMARILRVTADSASARRNTMHVAGTAIWRRFFCELKTSGGDRTRLRLTRKRAPDRRRP